MLEAKDVCSLTAATRQTARTAWVRLPYRQDWAAGRRFIRSALQYTRLGMDHGTTMAVDVVCRFLHLCFSFSFLSCVSCFDDGNLSSSVFLISSRAWKRRA